MTGQVLRTEDETQAWGRAHGERLGPGAVVGLVGELGAGKTQLAKGLAAGLGFRGEVTSPTFPLVHEYTGGRVPIFHLDFHRIGSADELLAIGWEEYLEAEGVCVVEWADRFPELMPEQTEWWELRQVGGGAREVTSLKRRLGAGGAESQPES